MTNKTRWGNLRLRYPGREEMIDARARCLCGGPLWIELRILRGERVHLQGQNRRLRLVFKARCCCVTCLRGGHAKWDTSRWWVISEARREVQSARDAVVRTREKRQAAELLARVRALNPPA